MSFETLDCPHCGKPVKEYRNPAPTVDIIIEVEGGIVLIERRNEPFGWAIPGGYVDYGESVEDAATREAKEETGLDVTGLKLLGCYSDPRRDSRHHNISITFTASAAGMPVAGDDAKTARVFAVDNLPSPLCFDHRRILDDYLLSRKSVR